MEKASKAGEPGLTRSQQHFEKMIEGLDRARVKAFFIEFLEIGLDTLSAATQNYLVKRIHELTDKATNEG